MDNESKTFTFNPAGDGGGTVIRPRPASVQLTEVKVDTDDGAKADSKALEKLGTRNRAQHDNIENLKTKYKNLGLTLESIYGDQEPGKTLQLMFGQSLESLDWTYRCYEVAAEGSCDLAGQPLFQK